MDHKKGYAWYLNINVKIPPKLKKQFRAYCFKNEITMTDKIVELVQGELRNNE